MAFIKRIKRKWQGQEKWTVTTVDQGSPVSTKELCEYIADSTTASASDVMAVLLALPKVMELYLKNGRAVKLDGIGTYRYKVSAGMVDEEKDAGESLIRDIRVQFTPERKVTAIGTQRVVRRALIPDGLTWEIYDKPSKYKKPANSTTGEEPGGETPGGDGTTPPSGGGGGEDQ